MKMHPKDVTLADLGKLATKDLLAVYNHHADKPVARFADHPSGFRRTKALLEAKGVTAPKPPAAKLKVNVERLGRGKARSKVLVAPSSNLKDQKEFHSVLAAFKALKLPVEKHQRFRREVKLNGQATFDKFTFTATY